VWLGEKGNQAALSIDLLNTVVSTFLVLVLYGRDCPKRLVFMKLKYCRRFKIINGAQKRDTWHNDHLRTTVSSVVQQVDVKAIADKNVREEVTLKLFFPLWRP